MEKQTTFFRNYTINKKKLKEIMSWAFDQYGGIKASYLADQLKDIGFKYATRAGISLSIEDLRVPPSKKSLMQNALKNVSLTELLVDRGELTEVERFQQVINTWNNISESLKDEVVHYFSETDPLNSIYMMAFSGARGNISQVRQLVGMRGLMADPNGQIIDLPITANFREGLTITDYLISSYGARKGLVDTALRTADSGYLTRRLIDVAQDIITRERDCGTNYGILLTDIIDGNNVVLSANERLIGRVLAKAIFDLKTNSIIYKAGTIINEQIAEELLKFNSKSISRIIIRSPLTCLSRRSVCQYCYGWNLAYRNLIDLGEAVGIIAAQSIGEPGTQLTMRTFHTGGVFTSEPTRQVAAKFSGQINFSKNLKTRPYRTQYGLSAQICENESFISLKTYQNQILKINVQPDTILFIKKNSFVKKNDILLEYAAQIKKTGEEKAFKDVFVKHSGEIFYENNNLSTSNNAAKAIWVLRGQVYNVPKRSIFLIDRDTSLKTNQIISQLKQINRTAGIVNAKITDLKQVSNEFEILNYSSAFTNKQVYLTRSLNKQIKCVFYGANNQQINLYLKNKTNTLDLKNPFIGTLEEKCYRVKTGGLFYSSNYNSPLQTNKAQSLTNKVGGTVLYIPEITHQVNCEIDNLKIKRGSFIKGKTQLYRGKTISSVGIVDFKTNKQTIDKLIVKPGCSISIPKEKNLLYYHQQIVYPGEILFGTIQIKRLSFVEIKTIDQERFLWIYPIIRYEISNRPFNLDNFSKTYKNKNEFKLNQVQLNVEINSRVEQNTGFQLVNRKIYCSQLKSATNLTGINELNNSHESNSNVNLKLQLSEKINPNYSLSNETGIEQSDSIQIIQTNQYIEPYTVVSVFPIKAKSNLQVSQIKEQSLRNERKIILVGSDSYKNLYLEDNWLNVKFNTLTKVGDKVGNNLVINSSGLISNNSNNRVSIRNGDPYLFSAGATARKQRGDIVDQSQILGQLLYERAKTGDIVQGLPRVEEILEARKPKIEAVITNRPAFIKSIISNSTNTSIFVYPTNGSFNNYSVPITSRILVGEFEFINIGQPLNDHTVNPHILLETLFNYFQNLKIFNIYQSAYRSLRKIQALLVTSVQSVYYSQGVAIADKHIEVIVKQMTGKVQVTTSGHSALLMNEFIELEQVDYVNKSLNNKDEAKFKPILLGITKASLKTESFISAASFQHTTRILTEAAVQGKIDWLRGLKENVIVGRLIPSGTGFNAYSDISYIGAKIPSSESIIKNNYNSKKLQTKYKKLKKRIKFN